MSERRERPDGPSKRPSRPQGPSKSSKSSKSRAAGSSRAGGSRSGRSRSRRSSDASMSRGPRPIVAERQSPSAAPESRTGSRRGARKKNDKNAMVLAIVGMVVLVAIAGFGTMAYTMGMFGGEDPANGENGSGDPIAGFDQPWTEQQYKDPFVYRFGEQFDVADMTEFSLNNKAKTFKKWWHKNDVKRYMGGDPNMKSDQQDGSEGTKWVYGTGTGDLFSNDAQGYILIFNRYDELVYAYYIP